MNSIRKTAFAAAGLSLLLGVSQSRADDFVNAARAAMQLALSKDQTTVVKRSGTADVFRREGSGFGVELAGGYELNSMSNLSRAELDARMGGNAGLRGRIFGGKWFDIATLRARVGNYGRVDEVTPRSKISDVASDLQLSLFSTVVSIRKGADAPLQIKSSPVRRTLGKISIPLVAPIASITGSYGASLVNSGQTADRIFYNGAVQSLRFGQSFAPKLSTAAHLEASLNLLLARAGLGGEIALNSSEAKSYADLQVSDGLMNIGSDLRVKLLDGRAYGFVEVRRLLGGWRRIADVTVSRFSGSQLGTNRILAQVGLFNGKVRSCISQECGTTAALAAAYQPFLTIADQDDIVRPDRAPASDFRRITVPGQFR